MQAWIIHDRERVWYCVSHFHTGILGIIDQSTYQTSTLNISQTIYNMISHLNPCKYFNCIVVHMLNVHLGEAVRNKLHEVERLVEERMFLVHQLRRDLHDVPFFRQWEDPTSVPLFLPSHQHSVFSRWEPSIAPNLYLIYALN